MSPISNHIQYAASLFRFEEMGIEGEDNDIKEDAGPGEGDWFDNSMVLGTSSIK
jgi:hypothetical protein